MLIEYNNWAYENGTAVVQMQLQYPRLDFHGIDKLRVQYKRIVQGELYHLYTETFMLPHKLNFNSTTHIVRGTVEPLLMDTPEKLTPMI